MYNNLSLIESGLYVYVGLFVISLAAYANCVPGLADWSHAGLLSYESIYNTTTYAQLQYNSIPYDLPTAHKNKHNDMTNSIEDDCEENDITKDDDVQLWIGVSHDPFKYSFPVQDYLKENRDINPIYSKRRNSENRGKRGVLHLYNMIMCATGCEPLSYKGYGCYCGFLGAGRPADGIDRCCKMHDECYENVVCPFYTVYFQPYYWKCHKGRPLCALENYRTENRVISGCAARLCECDRKFAMCIQSYPCPRRRALCRSSPIRFLQNILMFR